MSVKRFVQLLVCYALSILVGLGLVNLWQMEDHFWSAFAVVTVIGYIVLCVPLTVMTLMKNKAKD